MTVVSNDPTLWPTISATRFSSYFAVAAFVGVAYDWVLTFGQEVELIWRQCWSLMTVLYISARYLGMLYAALVVLSTVPTVSLTDTCPVAVDVSYIMYLVQNWTTTLVVAMLWVIIITRLHAMYQRSRRILISLTVTFLAVEIFEVVVAVMTTIHTSGEEYILSSAYICHINDVENILMLLYSITWIFRTVWEVLALSLAVWIAVKHFRELRRYSAGGIIGDCFEVLMKTHLAYFASVIAISCFDIIIYLSPTFAKDPTSLEAQVLYGMVQLLTVVQMFVLGPRMILGVREHHAKLVADSDAATGMTSIAFQEHVHVSTSSSV
ncbi:uncharacterized protein EDB93DRAFT_1255899 [Suillus bovinus]|uniref:uncharacterized protein n=1 Tax=Suillus bovinus TaxID=48563 RepID=UPI001B878AE3|nr:uncharacterized protein EDB93DRAFT_1255899 [Suillus bovinus]KAG2130420.1 hypothetical protein EDB93DRAFT_1255899 [Suillus bovinus]